MSDWSVVAEPKAAPTPTPSDWAVVPPGEPAPAPVPVAPEAPPIDDRGFFAKAWDSIKSGVHAVKHVGGDVIDTHGRALLDPAKRHELERGIGDVVTLGYGNRLAARVGNALGDVSRGTSLNETQHFSADPTQGNVTAPSEVESREAAAAPEYRAAGQVAGTLLPNPVSKVIGPLAGKVVSKAAAPLAGAFAKVTETAAKVPFAGPALATGAAALGGAAQGVANYEATAPLASALGAGAEGHRLEAAEQAATDPAGLLLSGAAGALPAGAHEAAGQAAKYIGKAQKSADAWLVNDVVGVAKGDSRKTSRVHLAHDADDVRSVLKVDPELRDAVSAARTGSVDSLKAVQSLIRDRLSTEAEPRADAYREAQAALPAPIRYGDVRNALLKEARRRVDTGLGEDIRVGKGLLAEVESLDSAGDWGAKREPVLSPETARQLKDAEVVRENMKGKNPETVKQLDNAIAKLRASATGETVSVDPDREIGLLQLRKKVSSVQRSARDAAGQLEGTPLAEYRQELARTFDDVLGDHISKAREKAPDAVAAIEDYNRKASALLNMGRVIDERLTSSTEKSTGAGGHTTNLAHGLKAAAMKAGPLPAAAVLASTGHYVPAAGVLAAAAAPAIKRVVDTNIAKFASTPRGQRIVARLVHASATGNDAPGAIQRAIAAGVPPRVAQKIADISRQTFASQPADTTADASP